MSPRIYRHLPMESAQKILLITSSYPADLRDARASAGMFVRDFALQLAARRALIVLTQHTGSGPSQVQEDGFEVDRFSWSGGNRALANLRLPADVLTIGSVMLNGMIATLRVVRRQKIDHVLALWAIPSGLWGLVAKWILRVPYSVWCLGQDVWNYQGNWLTRGLLRLILRQAKCVYADGFKLCDEVQQISGRTCHYLPSSRRLIASGGSATNVVAGKRNYLFIGRYHHNKGPDILLHAIKALPESIRKGSHFHFFGGGPLEAELKRLAVDDVLVDAVSINGFIDEQGAVSYLQQCDGVIIPSRIETISMVVWDALQTGISIIASDAGDMGTFFGKHPVAQVVNANSAEALAEGIVREFQERPDYTLAKAELLERYGVRRAVEQFIVSALTPVEPRHGID